MVLSATGSIPSLSATPSITPALSATPSIAPGVSTQTLGPDVAENPLLIQIVNPLEIGYTLTWHGEGEKSLRMWYKKYNTWNEAYAKISN